MVEPAYVGKPVECTCPRNGRGRQLTRYDLVLVGLREPIVPWPRYMSEESVRYERQRAGIGRCAIHGYYRGAMKVYYFGCQDTPGHYLYDGKRSAHPNTRAALPWSKKLDGGLCPQDGERQEEFVACVHHLHGWTAIAFWDRTGDRRGNSNSVFLIDEKVDFERGLALAKDQYPWLFERFGEEIRLHVPKEDSAHG